MSGYFTISYFVSLYVYGMEYKELYNRKEKYHEKSKLEGRAFDSISAGIIDRWNMRYKVLSEAAGRKENTTGSRERAKE